MKKATLILGGEKPEIQAEIGTIIAEHQNYCKMYGNSKEESLIESLKDVQPDEDLIIFEGCSREFNYEHFFGYISRGFFSHRRGRDPIHINPSFVFCAKNIGDQVISHSFDRRFEVINLNDRIERLIMTFDLPLIESTSFIPLIVSKVYAETGNKCSINFCGSKGYLDHISIRCEGYQTHDKNRLEWGFPSNIFTAKGAFKKKKVHIFHSEANGIRIELESEKE